MITALAGISTGVIAGGAVRSVIQAAGYQDILTKSLGSKNHQNVVKATMQALLSLRTEQEVRAMRKLPMPEEAPEATETAAAEA